jgi:hypothetical protein
MEGGDRVNGGWHVPPPSASSAENTIMAECTQESGHLHACSLCTLWSVNASMTVFPISPQLQSADTLTEPPDTLFSTSLMETHSLW